MGEVFISRTSDMARFPAGRSFVDAAIDAVNQARRTPVDMRYFIARDGEPASYCRQRVREADVYVALIGLRYGSLVPGEDISYTEQEFREATAAGKPRLVFLLDQDTPVPPEFADPDLRRIEDFRARLQRSGLITAMFTTPAELALEIFKALGELPDRVSMPPGDGHGRVGRRLSALTPAEMADRIAVAVRRQWEAEAELRRVNDPYTIPMRWETAEEDLVVTWTAVERVASSAGWPAPDRSRWTPGAAGLAGGGDIAWVLKKVPTGRLVVLGEPGAGKTILAVRLVLDLLEPTRRTPGGPVPVLIPLASWDPAREHLWDWLERRLCLEYRALRARAPGGQKVTWARALWDAGLLLPVLDGLDEISGLVRGRALARVNEALRPGVGLVLTARTDSYREAVRGAAGVRLSGAAGIQLCPLADGVVEEYLREAGGGPEAAARWDRLLGALADPSQPVAKALTTPLTATLARAVYSPWPGEPTEGLPHPDELLDPGLNSRVAIERHLFDGYLPAAYRPHRDPARRCPWKAADAHRWLVFLAGHLEHRLGGTTDLAWWELHTATPRFLPGLVGGLLFGLAGGAAYALLAGLEVGLTAWVAWWDVLLLLGLMFGLASGLAFGLAYGLPFGRADRSSQPARGLRWSLHAGRLVLVGVLVGGLVGFAGGFTYGLAYGLVIGPVFGLAAGLAGGLVFGRTEKPSQPGWRSRPSPRLGRFTLTGIVLGGGLMAALGDGVGLVGGLMGGLMAGLLAWLLVRLVAGLEPRPVEPTEATDPRTVLVQDRRTFGGIVFVVGLAAVLAERLANLLVGMFTADVYLGAWKRLVAGFVVGLVAGRMVGLSRTAWGPFVLARCWLALRGRLPWRLMRFLADANQHRGVLRQAGAFYQFRHIELQRRLGSLARLRGDYRTAEDEKGTAATHGNLAAVTPPQDADGVSEEGPRHALATFEEPGNRDGVSVPHLRPGSQAWPRDDYADMEEHHRRDLAMHEESGDERGVAVTHGDLAAVAALQGDYKASEEHHRRALAAFVNLDDRAGIAFTHVKLGLVAQLRGDYLAAEECYRRSLAIREELDNRVGVAAVQVDLGALYTAQGRAADGVPLALAGLVVLREFGARAASSALNVLREQRKMLGGENFDAAMRKYPDPEYIQGVYAMLDDERKGKQ